MSFAKPRVVVVGAGATIDTVVATVKGLQSQYLVPQ
jgi:cation diffusion facilitator CzcD-associated flavoprotein CzcO